MRIAFDLLLIICCGIALSAGWALYRVNGGYFPFPPCNCPRCKPQ